MMMMLLLMIGTFFGTINASLVILLYLYIKLQGTTTTFEIEFTEKGGKEYPISLLLRNICKKAVLHFR